MEILDWHNFCVQHVLSGGGQEIAFELVTFYIQMVSRVDYKALLVLQSFLFTLFSSITVVNYLQWKLWILKERW